MKWRLSRVKSGSHTIRFFDQTRHHCKPEQERCLICIMSDQIDAQFGPNSKAKTGPQNEPAFACLEARAQSNDGSICRHLDSRATTKTTATSSRDLSDHSWGRNRLTASRSPSVGQFQSELSICCQRASLPVEPFDGSTGKRWARDGIMDLRWIGYHTTRFTQAQLANATDYAAKVTKATLLHKEDKIIIIIIIII